ncbi:hypothetical protein SteCoe_17164 [Stentor coeruleus]|uniref:Uncharacterized protein n=1 Tax=Stentor coeruleus TaxID=5963 RepID=A0A1R2BZJ6_9CILI|nr:hypothetical protein SteCoe_17164 [Stentor coeruleus]
MSVVLPVSSQVTVFGVQAETKTVSGCEIKNEGENAYIAPGPFNQYNFFVEQYNNITNRQGEFYMKKIPAFRIMLQPRLWILLVTLGLCCIPFTCFPMLVLGIIRFGCCLMVRYIVRVNKKLIPNPFKRMIKVPDSSCINNSVNGYYSITPIEFNQRLTGIGISIETINLFIGEFQTNFQRGEDIHVMLYSYEFEVYYTGACDKMHIKDILSIAIIILSVLSIVSSASIINS